MVKYAKRKYVHEKTKYCQATVEKTITLSVPKPRENDESKQKNRRNRENRSFAPISVRTFRVKNTINIYRYTRRLGPASLLGVPGLAAAERDPTLAPSPPPSPTHASALANASATTTAKTFAPIYFPPAATRRPTIPPTVNKSTRRSRSLSNGNSKKRAHFLSPLQQA